LQVTASGVLETMQVLELFTYLASRAKSDDASVGQQLDSLHSNARVWNCYRRRRKYLCLNRSRSSRSRSASRGNWVGTYLTASSTDYFNGKVTCSTRL